MIRSCPNWLNMKHPIGSINNWEVKFVPWSVSISREKIFTSWITGCVVTFTNTYRYQLSSSCLSDLLKEYYEPNSSLCLDIPLVEPIGVLLVSAMRYPSPESNSFRRLMNLDCCPHLTQRWIHCLQNLQLLWRYVQLMFVTLPVTSLFCSISSSSQGIPLLTPKYVRDCPV